MSKSHMLEISCNGSFYVLFIVYTNYSCGGHLDDVTWTISANFCVAQWLVRSNFMYSTYSVFFVLNTFQVRNIDGKQNIP